MTRQSGAALLALMTVLIAVAVAAVATTWQPAAKARQDELAERRVLSLAREALLGYAQQRYCLNPALPLDALFPCPDDAASEGVAAASCPADSFGWLPWRTLGLTPLRDASGTCLWIERHVGTVRVIAPGGARPGQSRTSAPTRPVCGGDLLAANYIDAGDASLTLTLSPAMLAGVCPP